jgi:hypothetical protein
MCAGKCRWELCKNCGAALVHDGEDQGREWGDSRYLPFFEPLFSKERSLFDLCA